MGTSVSPCLASTTASCALLRASEATTQGLTLVHILAQPEPFWSLKPVKHPKTGEKSAHVELKFGRG